MRSRLLKQKAFSWPAVLVILLLFTFPQETFIAAQTVERVLIPMGGGDEQLLEDFLENIIPQVSDSPIRILILPISYTSHPQYIPGSELKRITAASDTLQALMLQTCSRLAKPSGNCEVEAVPVFLRDQADQPELDKYFRPGLTAVYIPEGPAGAPTQLIQGTHLERLLAQAYREGVFIAASNAGASLMSSHLLTGYQSGFGKGNSLECGAVKQDSKSLPGLSLGLDNLIIDPYFFQRGRFGRLLNAIALPGGPGIGLGLDESSGVQIRNEQIITSAFGEFGITILDGSTYHAVDSVTYQGEHHHLRLRNVLVHMLSQGDFYYDLKLREHSLAAAPERIERQFEGLKLPLEAGVLLISSNIHDDTNSARIVNQLVNFGGGKKAQITAVLLGKPGSVWVESAQAWLLGLYPGRVQVLTPPEDVTKAIEIPSNTTGLILWGLDQSAVHPAQLEPIKKYWLTGTPLLAADSGSAVIGRYYSARPANPETELAAETYTQGSLRKGGIQINPGVGLIEANFEPNLLNNNRWGRLIALASNYPNLVAFGLNQNASILLDHSTARILGQEQVVAFDLRYATLALRENQVFVFANGLLDLFTSSDVLEAEAADVNSLPLRMATPLLPSFSPSQTAIPQVLTQSTRTPLPSGVIKTPHADFIGVITPTPTPIEEPEVIDPGYLHAMIFLGLFSVSTVILGIWINLLRMKSR